MSRILVMPDGNFLAHTSRALVVASALRDLGHDIVFAGDGDFLRLPREKRFPVVFAKTLSQEHQLGCVRRGRVNLHDNRSLREAIEDDLRVFDQLRPDLVVADLRLSASTSCELAHLPLVTILNAAWTNYYSVRVKAPEHHGATRLMGKPLADLVAPWIKSMTLYLDVAVFRATRRAFGLDPRHNFFDMMRGDLNLMVDTPSYAPTAALPDDFHYIGPILWEPDVPLPDWFDELDDERPTIYFTMGSTGFPRFFEQAVEIFGETEYQCVMTTAGMARFPSLPSNFFCTDYAPGSKIMEKSDAVVCQGGNGTIYQAASRGVPVIGIPTMHDQEFNLERVVALGMGIHLSELHFRPQHLRDAVAAVIREPRFKRAAEEQRAEIERYDAPRAAATLIEHLLESRARVVPACPLSIPRSARRASR